ncbi:hypothetical protein QE152_g7160 [Popillia japonica]|uniref:Uncharacterized protein n=1 Tax=Popillia japonica TaxID=7064 RepID=A0AAW1MEU0_POPJA
MRRRRYAAARKSFPRDKSVLRLKRDGEDRHVDDDGDDDVDDVKWKRSSGRSALYLSPCQIFRPVVYAITNRACPASYPNILPKQINIALPAFRKVSSVVPEYPSETNKHRIARFPEGGNRNWNGSTDATHTGDFFTYYFSSLMRRPSV